MKLIINATIYLLFISMYFFDGFLGDGLGNFGLHLIPNKLSWACELLSSAIALYFFVILALKKKIFISWVYLFYFLFFILLVLSGIILNSVAFGAIFAGIRRYFLFLPLFFLPTVYEFSESEIKNHIKFILILSLIQIPFAAYQRFYLFKSFNTGDFVTGTLLSSTVLSLNQLICIAILCAIYIKKRIKLPLFIVILILLLFPTAINETKATLILLPIAISIPILFGTNKIFSIKKIFLICSAGIISISIFIPLYSHLYNSSILDFFDFAGQDQGDRTIKGYLYKGLSVREIDEEPGRIDAIIFPFKILHNKPFKLIFGLGIGNVNSSGIGKFKGQFTIYDKYGANAISAASMIWETGLIGFILYLIFFGIILFDSFRLKSMTDFFGAIALGWIAVVLMLYLCLFYANIFHIKAIGYLFYYASGIIVSKRAQIEKI